MVDRHGERYLVLSQAAARAYPDLYRLLGGTITEETHHAVQG